MSPTLRFSKPILPGHAVRKPSENHSVAEGSDDEELVIDDSVEEDSSDTDSSDSKGQCSKDTFSEEESSDESSSVGDLVEGDGKCWLKSTLSVTNCM